MRNTSFLAIVLFATVLFLSCSNDDTSHNFDWEKFKSGVINSDKSAIEKVIPILLSNTHSKPTANDLIGQKANIDKLINAINESEVLTAELFCYACIKTYPAQSEIAISTDSMGLIINRIIDISTPDDNILKFVGIHNKY